MVGPAFALLMALSMAPMCFGQALSQYEPAIGCYIGAYIEMDPVARDDVATFEALTGKKHASYFRYVGYGQPFPFEWADKLKAAGAAPHIAWEPNDGLAPVKDDAYLQGWVQACAHYGGPIFLRFASEMNGDWEAWSGNPDLFVEKWRLVYKAFHQGAPNVILVWCPFATPKSTIPLYYPGDDYVDWVGVNVFSVVHENGDASKRTVDNAVQHLEFIYNLYADRKPIAVCEYAATHYCKASGAMTADFAIREMKRMYESIETRFPRVRMINWFSVDAATRDLADNDYSITSSEQVLNAYRTLVSSGHFLGAISEAAGGAAVMLPGAAFPPMAPAGNGSALGGPGIGGTTVIGLTGPGAGAAGPLPVPRTGAPLAAAGSASPGFLEIAIIIKGGQPAALEGRATVEAVLGAGLRPAKVTFELDGRFRATSTTPAYFFPWNTAKTEPGEHRIRAVAKDAAGAVMAETEASVIVAERD